jgi:hypothetical protein
MAKSPRAEAIEDMEVANLNPTAVATPPLPSFEIAERRAKYGDVATLREMNAAAALKDQAVPMVTRWIYTGPGAPLDRFYEVIAQKGYQQVHERELTTPAHRNGWGVSPEGYVTRGEKGHELLVKMPKHLYEQIQVRKALDGDAKRRSGGKMRQQTAEDLAEAGHPRAADAMARGTLQMSEFQETADVRKL